MTFTLTLELGNDAMQTGEDVAAALRLVADELEPYNQPFTVQDAVPLTSATGIQDLNGNTVGSWELRLRLLDSQL